MKLPIPATSRVGRKDMSFHPHPDFFRRLLVSSVGYSDPVPDPDPGFWWPKMGKNLSEKKFVFFWSKIAFYLSLGFRNGRPSYRRSLQPSKENIQHFRKWNLLTFFLFLCAIFALLDPDLDCESGSGSRNPTKSGSSTLLVRGKYIFGG